jgi:hypothetical protein
MTPRHSPQRAVGVRLLEAIDSQLRKKQRRKGDLSRLIFEAIQVVDLSSVPLTLFHGKRERVTAKVTQIVMPTHTRSAIEKWARVRKCSMNELLNSALTAGLVKTRSPMSSDRPGRKEPVQWSVMSPEARKRFFEAMLMLDGQESAPNLRSRDGSFYRFEPKLNGTVEVSADGRRYLVGCAIGGDLVRLRDAGHDTV